MNISQNFSPRAARPERSVSADILEPVKKDLGEGVLSGLDDNRVDILKRFFIDGEEFRDYDAIKQLGRGWVEKNSDNDFATHEFELAAGPNRDVQHLVVNANNDTISVTTADLQPGPYDGQVRAETLTWRIADDHVERSRACSL